MTLSGSLYFCVCVCVCYHRYHIRIFANKCKQITFVYFYIWHRCEKWKLLYLKRLKLAQKAGKVFTFAIAGQHCENCTPWPWHTFKSLYTCNVQISETTKDSAKRIGPLLWILIFYNKIKPLRKWYHVTSVYFSNVTNCNANLSKIVRASAKMWIDFVYHVSHHFCFLESTWSLSWFTLVSRGIAACMQYWM